MEENSKPDSDKELVNRAAELMRKGKRGQDEAAILLLRGIGKRLERYFKQKGMSHADAEELVNDTIVRFIQGDPNHGHALSPIAYFWTTARNAMLDRIDHDKAIKRGDQHEITLDDEGWKNIKEPSSKDIAEINALRDCLSRANGWFQSARPELAHMLILIAEQLSTEEIAIALGISNDAAKQRVCYARKAMIGYFKECKE